MKQNILTAFLTGLVFIIFCLVPTQACAKRVALVIGNGAYADAPLRNPVNCPASGPLDYEEEPFFMLIRP